MNEMQSLEPLVRVGKNGVTPALAEHIKKAFKKRKLIKIKFLAAALEDRSKKEVFNELAQLTGSKIVSTLGFTVVLSKMSQSYRPSAKNTYKPKEQPTRRMR